MCYDLNEFKIRLGSRPFVLDSRSRCLMGYNFDLRPHGSSPYSGVDEVIEPESAGFYEAKLFFAISMTKE